MTRRRRRRARGATLIEILISLAVVLVGMLALFKTLATSVTGSMTASRLTQAQQRAVLVTEAIRVAPKPAIRCLASTAASGWAACEAVCRANLLSGQANKAEACVYTTFDVKDESGCTGCTLAVNEDKTQQSYAVVAANPKQPTAVSQVRVSGLGSTVYDSQVVIGWRDDNTDPSQAPDHWVTLRSGVFVP